MNDINFGEWLSKQRKYLGMTQQQLAERINCATITVRKIEAQQRHPSVQIAEQMSRVFNIPGREHDGFIRFARGYEHSDPIYITQAKPWYLPDNSFTASPRLGPLAAGSDLQKTFTGGMYYLDSISKLFRLTGLPGVGGAWNDYKYHPLPTSSIPEGPVLLVMIPIRLLNQAVISIIQSLELSLSSGGSPLEEPIKPLDIRKLTIDSYLNGSLFTAK